MSAVPTGRPRVHQVLATLGYGDAIGHEVLGIQRVLRRAGFESEIFVETADPRLEDLTIDYRDLVGAVAPTDLLIHHFSIGSRASRTAYALPGRMALVYHNITPPEYFIGVHKDLVKLCFRGRRELTAYTSRCELALGDSDYNREELETLGFRTTGVLPVVPGFAHLAGPPDRIMAADFDDGWTNVVFVGRVIPNKKFEDVIRAFHAYRTRHNPRSRLLLIGSYSGFERYLAMLQALIAGLGTPDVHFLGHVSNEELTALYDIADLFLCASEHEGFCVPIVEAFYKQIPVLAYAATAVPATMDGGGVLYDTKDAFEIARLMDAVLDDVRIADAVVESQDAALARLQARDFDRTLLRFVNDTLATPPHEAPEVAWDFWQQFDQFERLEELRQFRPALYRALPLDPRLASRDSQPAKTGPDDSRGPSAAGSGARDAASAGPHPHRVGDPQDDASQPLDSPGNPAECGSPSGPRTSDPASRQ
jgi:glycosyltransferase involved in cell wall biosynthesis